MAENDSALARAAYLRRSGSVSSSASCGCERSSTVSFGELLARNSRGSGTRLAVDQLEAAVLADVRRCRPPQRSKVARKRSSMRRLLRQPGAHASCGGEQLRERLVSGRRRRLPCRPGRRRRRAALRPRPRGCETASSPPPPGRRAAAFSRRTNSSPRTGGRPRSSSSTSGTLGLDQRQRLHRGARGARQLVARQALDIGRDRRDERRAVVGDGDAAGAGGRCHGRRVRPARRGVIGGSPRRGLGNP